MRPIAVFAALIAVLGVLLVRWAWRKRGDD